MGVIKIEQFDVDTSGSTGTIPLINDVGNVNNAFIRINNGNSNSSCGPIGNTGNTAPNQVGIRLNLSATNEITYTTETANSLKVMGDVWRYEGSAGGEHEFIVRGRFTLNLNSASSISQAVSNIINVDKCVPFITGWTYNSTSRSTFQDCTLAARMDSSDNVIISKNNTNGNITVNVTVVEFTGSAWSVGHAFSNAHESNVINTITINTAADGVSGSTFDVGDWETAIIESTVEGDTSETGLSDCFILAAPGSTTTTVDFSLRTGDNNAQNDGIGWVHVIQNDSLVVKRNKSFVNEGNNTYDKLSIPAGVNVGTDISELALEWYVDTSGTGTAHARGRLGAALFNGLKNFTQGSIVTSYFYDSSQDATIIIDVTFNASPVGCLFEVGGTGTGTFIGYNDSGNFVARAGSGSTGTPNDCARVEVTPATYDFAGKSGILRLEIDLTASSITLRFDEGDTGIDDFTISNTSVSPMSDWSGGDDGSVGDTGGSTVAGSELTITTFNGTINVATIDQIGITLDIDHWIHRSGNTVVAWYGVADLSGLIEVVAATSVVRVEHFEAPLSKSGTNTYTLSNDVGDLTKAFLKFNTGTWGMPPGPTSTNTVLTPNFLDNLRLINTTTLSIVLGGVNTATWNYVGEVWRYIGPPGGSDEFISRGSYQVVVSGTTPSSTPVIGVANPDKCVPFITGCKSPAAYNQVIVSARMDSSGNLILSKNSSGNSTVQVNVVEFVGSNWSVGHGVSSNHDLSTENVTLNTAADGVSGGTFDVGDWSNAFIVAYMGGDSTETRICDTSALVQPGPSTTQVSFSVTDLNVVARNDADAHIHVVRNPYMNVYRDQNLDLDDGDRVSNTIPFPAGTPTNRSIDELAMEWFVGSDGTDQNYFSGRNAARITDASGTITHWSHKGGDTVKAYYGVIDLSGLQNIFEPSAYIGSNQVTKAYIGSTEITDIYIGSKKVF